MYVGVYVCVLLYQYNVIILISVLAKVVTTISWHLQLILLATRKLVFQQWHASVPSNCNSSCYCISLSVSVTKFNVTIGTTIHTQPNIHIQTYIVMIIFLLSHRNRFLLLHHALKVWQKYEHIMDFMQKYFCVIHIILIFAIISAFMKPQCIICLNANQPTNQPTNIIETPPSPWS